MILAGGKGTRLGSLTNQTPKVLVPILGRPVLDYQLHWLADEGVTEVILLTGHLHDQIEAYCGDGSRWGIKIVYRVELTPLGTAGALKGIEDILTEDFLVVYGDVMVNMDLRAMMRFHTHLSDPCATLMVHPNNHPHDSDLIEFDHDFRIQAFHGKPHDPSRFFHNQVNAAVYILSPRIFSYLTPDQYMDLGKDIFPDLVVKERFYAYPSAEYLKDMGSPERLSQVEKDISSGKMDRLNRKNPRPAIFLDRDGVLCYHVDFMSDRDQLRLFPDIPSALKRINESGYLAVVVTNQPVVARGLTDENGVRRIHQKMEFLLGEAGAYFDGIYFCPHHPDSGFSGENQSYKLDCDCRKPKSGMLLQAAQFFNIDLPNSYIVGDTWRDIGAGREAGLKKCLGVKKNLGRVGEFRDQLPDKLFNDLQEAVAYILDEAPLN